MSSTNIAAIIQWLIVAAVILAIVGFVLGKRKTGKPIITGLSLGLSAFVPIVGIVYLVFLLNKPDLPQAS